MRNSKTRAAWAIVDKPISVIDDFSFAHIEADCADELDHRTDDLHKHK